MAYHVGDYDQLFQLLESRTYCESSHAELQSLWFAGQYAVAQARVAYLVLFYFLSNFIAFRTFRQGASSNTIT